MIRMEERNTAEQVWHRSAVSMCGTALTINAVCACAVCVQPTPVFRSSRPGRPNVKLENPLIGLAKVCVRVWCVLFRFGHSSPNSLSTHTTHAHRSTSPLW